MVIFPQKVKFGQYHRERVVNFFAREWWR